MKYIRFFLHCLCSLPADLKSLAEEHEAQMAATKAKPEGNGK